MTNPEDIVYDEAYNRTLPDKQATEIDELQQKIEELNEEFDEDAIEFVEKAVKIKLYADYVSQKASVIDTIIKMNRTPDQEDTDDQTEDTE